jgi:hypothetical protein
MITILIIRFRSEQGIRRWDNEREMDASARNYLRYFEELRAKQDKQRAAKEAKNTAAENDITTDNITVNPNINDYRPTRPSPLRICTSADELE